MPFLPQFNWSASAYMKQCSVCYQHQ